MRKLVVTLAVLTLAALPALAGEWHTGQNNLCADCHTMHNSMSHGWNGSDAVSVGTPSKDGNWVRAGSAGAGDYLLKAEDPNALCLSCHNGTVDFAPSVLEAKSGKDAANRSAGYLNQGGAMAHTGHTIGQDSAGKTAPGGTFVAGEHGLECVNCHTQHGRAGVYRNLGPRTGQVPSYALNGRLPHGVTGGPITLDDAKSQPLTGVTLTGGQNIDIFIDAQGYQPNTGNFAAYYETANIKYLKRAGVAAGEVENRSGNQCANCHGAFHGGRTSGNIGGEVVGNGYGHFNRHPVGGVVLGATGAGGYSPAPSARYAHATSVSKIKVYASDQTNFTDASPGCISCHKAHGNGQPFGLIFANRTVAGMSENGTLAANATPTATQTAEGQRALCGQCHGQGN